MKPNSNASSASADTSADRARRARMVEEQLAARGIQDPRLLDAFRRVPRHLFVPAAERARAYDDSPLPIGHGQTISQPFMIALMVDAARLRPGARVLEIGTGCGYGAAILALVAEAVWTVEFEAVLAEQAAARLAALGYRNVAVRAGDGYDGWPEAAPFDAIILTCAPDHLPPRLAGQLAVGGRLVAPIGPAGGLQVLTIYTRTADGLEKSEADGCYFVPMRGRIEEEDVRR